MKVFPWIYPIDINRTSGKSYLTGIYRQIFWRTSLLRFWALETQNMINSISRLRNFIGDYSRLAPTKFSRKQKLMSNIHKGIIYEGGF